MSTDRDALVDRLATAVRAVPGVSDLHAGALGEAVTLLPGRRVPGLRIADESVEVHIAVEHGAQLRETADQVRAAVSSVRPGPVTVVVEDVVEPEPDPIPTDSPSTERSSS